MARMNTDPDAGGHFGRFGGKYVPEALMHALDELEQAFTDARADDDFNAELDTLRRECAGRPKRAAARASTSSARTSRTPARTRSIMCSVSACSPAGWARSGSSR